MRGGRSRAGKSRGKAVSIWEVLPTPKTVADGSAGATPASRNCGWPRGGREGGRGRVIVGERRMRVGMRSRIGNQHTWDMDIAIARPIEIVVGRDHVVLASEPEGTGGGATRGRFRGGRYECRNGEREEVQIGQISETGYVRANGRRGSRFPRVQLVGEPPNDALEGGEGDCPTRILRIGSD
jgi:hypothetical protein